MPLTRDFKETVQARAERDPAFREGLLKEGVECLLAGDVDAGKIVLRDYINATIGFKELGSLTSKPPKSLMRMFGPTGNPHARNLLKIISCIQQHEGVQLRVNAVRCLFDDRVRSYEGFRNSVESQFDFLDRSAQEPAIKARGVVESWFTRIPDGEKEDIRERFRAQDDRYHVGALLELFIHEILLQVGTEVQSSPDLNGGTPDFAATYQGERVIVECTVVHDSDDDVAESRRWGTMKAAIDSLDTGRFSLVATLLAVGPSQPSAGQLRREIEHWLGRLDPDAMIQQLELGNYIHEPLVWRRDGWEVAIDAMPMPPGYVRGQHESAFGLESSGGGWDQEDTRLRRTVERKAKRYHPRGQPYVIVVGSGRDLASSDDMETALLGRRVNTYAGLEGISVATPREYQIGGLFGVAAQPRKRHVSAVLFKPRLNIWTFCGEDDPWRLIRNPWADTPLPLGMFPFAVGDSGRQRTVNGVLGLPEQWHTWSYDGSG